MQIKSKSKTYITGRGDVYLIDLKENNLPQTREELREVLFLGKEITIDNISGNIIGIEAHVVGDKIQHQSIGIIIKESEVSKYLRAMELLQDVDEETIKQMIIQIER